MSDDKKPTNREVTFSWYTPSGTIDPLQLRDIADQLARHSNDVLPGDVITGITFDGAGQGLRITMRTYS